MDQELPGASRAPARSTRGCRRLSERHIIIATGSDAVIPPIEGLDTVPVWTSREATALRRTDHPFKPVQRREPQ